MTQLIVKLDKYELPISKQNAPSFITELDDFMLIAKLTDTQIKFKRGDKHRHPQYKNHFIIKEFTMLVNDRVFDSVGYNVQFEFSTPFKISVSSRYSAEQLYLVGEYLKNKYGKDVTLIGKGQPHCSYLFAVIGNELAMIDLFQQLKCV